MRRRCRRHPCAVTIHHLVNTQSTRMQDPRRPIRAIGNAGISSRHHERILNAERDGLLTFGEQPRQLSVAGRDCAPPTTYADEVFPLPVPPYLVVVFVSRRTEDDAAGYAATAEAMDRLAREQPGFLGIDSVH